MKDWITLIYFKLKSTSWKTDLDDFVDEFDSRHDNRRIKLHDINSNVDCAGSVWELCCSLSICLNLFWFRDSACFAHDKTAINQRRVEKSAFEDQSEENSVLITKWTTLFGIFCKISFTPAVTSCYQVHALNADAHLSAVLLLLLRCNWCQNLAAVTCILHWIVLTLSMLHTRNSSCITSLWLHLHHDCIFLCA